MSDVDNVEAAPAQILEDLTRAELMKRAVAVYNVSITKDMTKDQIIAAIRQKEKVGTFIQLAEKHTGPKPGWTRIIIHKNTDPKASNRQVFVGINGRRYYIPRGVEVDVPHKIVALLDTVKDKVLKENEMEPTNSRNRFYWEEGHTYPFNVIAVNPGPDPQPGDELSRGAKIAPKQEYRRKFGHWPTDQELRDAQRSGDMKRAEVGG